MPEILSFADAHAAARSNPGVTLFTVSIVTTDGQHVTRAYTSHQDVYPLDGLKPAGLVDPAAGTSYHPDRATIERLFPEHELILGLGGTAGINVSLLEDGALIGAVNFFHDEAVYTAASVPVAEAIAERLRPAIVAYRAQHS